MTLPGHACACGSPDLVSIAPGDAGQATDLLGQRLILEASTPQRAWCAACAPWLRWLQEAAQ